MLSSFYLAKRFISNYSSTKNLTKLEMSDTPIELIFSKYLKRTKTCSLTPNSKTALIISIASHSFTLAENVLF